MNTAQPAATSLEAPLGQRSRLLGFNRKLRHLHGITLRNLNLGSSHHRSRRKTIDDEALPSTLRTPAKLLAASESTKLTSSRSFTDLKSQAAVKLSGESDASAQNIPVVPQTPKRRQSYRISNLDWSNASPSQWQQVLRETLARTTADVFFTLHCPDISDPVYVSEVVYNTSNPNFQFFDLSSVGAAISRQDALIVNFWARKGQHSAWQHLLELFVSLRSLQYIGKYLEDYHLPLPENCVILHLQDGLYICLTDLHSDELPKHVPSSAQKEDTPDTTLPTSSYDALMRLATLDQCIQEAIATREKLTSEINDLISHDAVRFNATQASVTAKDSLATVQRANQAEKRQIESLNSKVADLRASLHKRRAAIKSGRAWQDSEGSRSSNNATELDTLHASQHAVHSTIQGQRRRICTDLSEIYPINPIPDKSLQFTICNLPLPNSTFTKSDISHNADSISAALGYTTHIVYLLSYYLSVFLPYPPTPHGSTSTIYDPISISLSQAPHTSTSHHSRNNSTTKAGSKKPRDPDRIFPLHITRNSPMYRFEYGVFLLNKDIETIACKLGLRILDIRQTLPNLKYILFVATAGDGELPMRKAGGVRGLLHPPGRGTLGSSSGTTIAEKGTVSPSVSEESSSSRPGSSRGIAIAGTNGTSSVAGVSSNSNGNGNVNGNGHGTDRSLADSLRRKFVTDSTTTSSSSTKSLSSSPSSFLTANGPGAIPMPKSKNEAFVK